MKNGISFVGCGFLLATMMLASASAQPYWGDRWAATTNPLDLTTEQMDQIQDIIGEWQKVLLPVRFNLRMRNLGLQRLMWDEDADPAEIETEKQKVRDLQTEMQNKLLERRAALKEVLTEEQQTQFDAQIMGFGFGGGPCGLGLGPGWGRGFGRRRGPGWGAGTAWGPGWGRGPGEPRMGRTG